MPYRDKNDPRIKEVNARYYLRTKEVYAELRKKRRDASRDRSREVIRDAKDKPCMDCGQRYPYYVMDFDHPDDNKVANVGRLSSSRLELILIEIAKCDVVCANCHRIRTYNRSMGV